MKRSGREINRAGGFTRGAGILPAGKKPFTKTRAGCPRHEGFTLVEVLVVIVIIAILGAIGVGVGYRLLSAGDEETTKTRLHIIMNAVNGFYEDTGDWPGDDEDENPGTYRIRIQRTDGTNTLDSYTNFVDRLRDLDEGAVSQPETDGDYDIFTFQDAWDQPIGYIREGGLGGTPLLVAPGRDNVYDTTDDIRSDR